MAADQIINNITAQRLFDMVMAGAANLDLNKEGINKLNVFPVPDGDTGTNMAMTMQSAAKFVRQAKEPSLENMLSSQLKIIKHLSLIVLPLIGLQSKRIL